MHDLCDEFALACTFLRWVTERLLACLPACLLAYSQVTLAYMWAAQTPCNRRSAFCSTALPQCFASLRGSTHALNAAASYADIHGGRTFCGPHATASLVATVKATALANIQAAPSLRLNAANLGLLMDHRRDVAGESKALAATIIAPEHVPLPTVLRHLHLTVLSIRRPKEEAVADATSELRERATIHATTALICIGDHPFLSRAFFP